MKQDLEFLQIRMAAYYDKNHREGPNLKEGGKVYLHTKNLKTQRPSRKLGHIREGPFKIKKKLEKNTYELDLPKGTKIHPVFHVALLEPANQETPLQETLHVEPPEEYEVEAIKDVRIIYGEK